MNIFSRFASYFNNSNAAKILPPGTLSFRCNICGSSNSINVNNLQREEESCIGCSSTVRMRAIVHCISCALFGESLSIDNFPIRKDIIGKGMSDWDGYAKKLTQKLGYVNTYYHKFPFLDITSIDGQETDSLDFLVSTDVFEHVSPPVSNAFKNARKLLKENGSFILSVPYNLEGETIEHFQDLFDYSVHNDNGILTLVNKRRDGSVEKFTELIFHGGEGDTIELRCFSESGLLRELKDAGFSQIKIMKEPCFKHGVYWHQPWSLPIIAQA